jgi:hypothetical protein
MNLMRYIITMSVFAASGVALAVTPQDQNVSTTADLIELCSARPGEPNYQAAMGFCFGYIDAAMDYHAALTEGPSYDPIACPETAVTREEVVVVLLEWSKRNAQYLEVERPVTGVMRAAAEKWPCAEQ